jgi:hypothetical protein
VSACDAAWAGTDTWLIAIIARQAAAAGRKSSFIFHSGPLSLQSVLTVTGFLEPEQRPIAASAFCAVNLCNRIAIAEFKRWCQK